MSKLDSTYSPHKFVSDFIITKSEKMGFNYIFLTIKDVNNRDIPHILPGQFVQIKIPHNQTYLRRPISIMNVNPTENSIDLLIANVGKGTQVLFDLKEGNTINIVYPLGNSFKIPTCTSANYLLVGGGVGIAPLLYLSKKIHNSSESAKVDILLGGKDASRLVLLEKFNQNGRLFTTTEDASLGEKGFVTNHSLWHHSDNKYDKVFCCGPLPMMKAVAKKCSDLEIDCEVSLENLMACGIGACLCCVEPTKKGNLCICTEGPVFDTKLLNW